MRLAAVRRLAAARWLSAASIRLAGTVPVAALLRALHQYPPRPLIAEGTVRVVEAYGAQPGQVGEWWVPPGADSADGGLGRLPTVLLVHGGYWRGGYDRSLENAVAADLAGRGYLCWVPDYRSSADPWPTTMADVVAAADHLARGRFAPRVDPRRLSFVGHSAGGHLVLWLASRARLPASAPEAFAVSGSTLEPALVVSQAGVGALTVAGTEGLGDGAARELVGGAPDQVDARYAVADPSRLLPTGIRTVLIHGTGDTTVPMSQSIAYREAAIAAGDDCTLVRVPGGHLDHLDPGSAAHQTLLGALPAASTT